MQRRNVDLPEPDGPMTHITSPRWTVRSMPLSTSSRPKRLCTPSASTIGGARPAPRRSRPSAGPLAAAPADDQAGRSGPVLAAPAPPSRRRSFCSGVSGSERWLPRA